MREFAGLRVAIVHDWLSVYAGAEKVLSSILESFPEADLYCLVDFLPEEDRKGLGGKKAVTSFVQGLPFAKKHYRLYVPLMPLAVEQFNLDSYDLIISSSHAVAKGVLTGPNQLHISYVHTPMRYAWDLQHQYLKEAGLQKGIRGMFVKLLLHYLRIWDRNSVGCVDQMIANSGFTQKRIQKIYNRDSVVVYPPVETVSNTPGERKEDFYLTVSRLVPYKKVGLLVEAFSEMPDKQLVVIGEGPQRSRIEAKCGKNVTLMGYQSTEVVRDYMQRARAFLFAAVEDFGITPVEAQACGTPVICYGRGGCLETIRGLDDKEPTGVFFQEQSKASVRQALSDFETNEHQLLPENCRKNALRFSVGEFHEHFEDYVETAWRKFVESNNMSHSMAPFKKHS
jgi:glycosyltransferase involved in cell wall biosynthesis